MKEFDYNYRRFDEEEFFQRYTREFGMELGFTEESPTLENCDLAAGADFVSVITTPITAPMLDRLKELGVRMISTRTIGYDHIDLEHAREIGMAVNHITYDPEGVAEYTVMGILMAVRRMKGIMSATMRNDFTLEGQLASKLGDMCVGVIGAGRIGRSVLRDLSGFGCRLLYANRTRNEEADRYAEHVSLEELLERSDVVSLHLELNGETKHVIDSERLAMMRPGSILVNTARGPLVDTKALIESLRNGHLGYAFLDVVEDEFGLYYNDCTDMDLEDHHIGVLRRMDNVIITHHMAFYYRTAVRDMIYNCLLGMKMLAEGREIPLRLA
ncbi:MAG: NAD(P)-binding domain-containing protein [archaeon]|nr:NAD(P)-binding domain-containing protein [archaeon]